MNHKRTFNLLSPNGVGWQLPKLVVSLAAPMLLALTACAPVPVGGLVAVPAAPVEGVAPNALADNEAIVVEKTTETNFLANNPELAVARRYRSGTQGGAAFLAANPELMVARRYSATVQANAQAATLAANPELSTARHYVPYTIDNQAASASFLAANPELMAARRYIGSTVLETDTAFLAANPELMVARRYRR